MDNGEAELLYELPLTIRIIDPTEYKEELRQQTGRVTRVGKKSPHGVQDCIGVCDRSKGQITTGRRNTRSKPPRHPIRQVEREFQRYKTGFLIRRGEEEQARAKRRARA